MAIFLDRIDAAPILEDDFSFAFRAWCGVLVDSLNEVINDVQNGFNFLTAPNLAMLTETVTLTSGSPSFAVADGTIYNVGDSVIGTGIPANTNVYTIVANTVTLTANATVTGAQSLTFIPIQGDIGNGVLLYDTTNNVYVGMQNGALVKFTTTSYP